MGMHVIALSAHPPTPSGPYPPQRTEGAFPLREGGPGHALLSSARALESFATRFDGLLSVGFCNRPLPIIDQTDWARVLIILITTCSSSVLVAIGTLSCGRRERPRVARRSLPIAHRIFGCAFSYKFPSCAARRGSRDSCSTPHICLDPGTSGSPARCRRPRIARWRRSSASWAHRRLSYSAVSLFGQFWPQDRRSPPLVLLRPHIGPSLTSVLAPVLRHLPGSAATAPVEGMLLGQVDFVRVSAPPVVDV